MPHSPFRLPNSDFHCFPASIFYTPSYLLNFSSSIFSPPTSNLQRPQARHPTFSSSSFMPFCLQPKAKRSSNGRRPLIPSSSFCPPLYACSFTFRLPRSSFRIPPALCPFIYLPGNQPPALPVFSQKVQKVLKALPLIWLMGRCCQFPGLSPVLVSGPAYRRSCDFCLQLCFPHFQLKQSFPALKCFDAGYLFARGFGP
jgi:hypothetical protein